MTSFYTILGAVENQPTESTPFTEILESKYPQQEHFVAEFFNVVAVMALVLLVMWGIAWVLKRFLNSRIEIGNTTSLIKIEDRRILGPKSQIYLIEVEGARFIIGETPNGLIKLGDVPASTNRAYQPPSDFSKMLDSPKS